MKQAIKWHRNTQGCVREEKTEKTEKEDEKADKNGRRKRGCGFPNIQRAVVTRGDSCLRLLRNPLSRATRIRLLPNSVLSLNRTSTFLETPFT